MGSPIPLSRFARMRNAAASLWKHSRCFRLARRISDFSMFVALIGAHKLHADQKGLSVEEAYANQLKRLIETQHGAKSTFVKSVRIHRAPEGQSNWDGVVHVFDLNDHPKAKRAFAWSSPISGSGGSAIFRRVADGCDHDAPSGREGRVCRHPRMGRTGNQDCLGRALTRTAPATGLKRAFRRL